MHLIANILQSTAFLTYNGFSYIGAFCMSRLVLGNINVMSSSFLPAWIASFMSLFIEKPERHSLLALYVTNVAIETLIKMVHARGFRSPLPHSEVLMFSLSLSMASWLYSQHKLHGILLIIMRFLFGDIHNVTRTEKSTKNYHHYLNAIKGVLKPFVLGVGVQAMLQLVSSWKRIVYKRDFQAFFAKKNLRLPLFLLALSSSYRVISSVLRQGTKWSDGKVASVTGLASGTALLIYPNISLVIYMTTKVAECMYGLGMEKGFVRSVPGFTVFLYATSTALLLHAAVVEPHNLKDSYWRFLNRITGNRISEMNRRLLDEFGFRSSTLQPSFWPQYDMTQVSPHLKEFMQKNAIPS
ncbi:unnamed protein product [Darwinula stevensoni]|nr:unnamed protein product [Darwinula stevensoni]CAG0879794.1 unnamed protein product [Darwinula stevensoni]